MKVHADLGKCEGYANCVVVAPDVFSIDDSGVVVVADSHPDEVYREAIGEAVRSCPVAALSIQEG